MDLQLSVTPMWVGYPPIDGGRTVTCDALMSDNVY